MLLTSGKTTTANVPAQTSTSSDLTTKVPVGATSGKLYVQVGSVKSNGMRFTVTTNGNQAPVVNAGSDQDISIPFGVALSATAADDGLPYGTLATTWSMLNGPGSVTSLATLPR